MTTQADSTVAVLRKSLDSGRKLSQAWRLAEAGERCFACGARARIALLLEPESVPVCVTPGELRSLLGHELAPCTNHDGAERRQLPSTD